MEDKLIQPECPEPVTAWRPFHGAGLALRLFLLEKVMFARIPYEFIDRGYLGRLTGSEVLVLMAFARHASFADNGLQGQTFVGLETVISRTGLSRPHVKRAVSSLAAKGHLVTLKRQRNKPTLRKVIWCPTE